MNNMEIERKWKISYKPEKLETYTCHTLEQAYLCASPTVRIRREDDIYYLTYKGIGDNDISHPEYNLPLTQKSYEHLLEKHDGIIIRKKRYVMPIQDTDLNIELDIFDAPYETLMIAEVEFPSLEMAKSFTAPNWFTEEVTHDPAYKNSSLAHAFRTPS